MNHIGVALCRHQILRPLRRLCSKESHASSSPCRPDFETTEKGLNQLLMLMKADEVDLGELPDNFYSLLTEFKAER